MKADFSFGKDNHLHICPQQMDRIFHYVEIRHTEVIVGVKDAVKSISIPRSIKFCSSDNFYKNNTLQ